MSLRPETMPFWWYETDRERKLRAAEDMDDGALEMAIIAHPDRAKALQQALATKPEPKPYVPPVWATWPLNVRGARSSGER